MFKSEKWNRPFTVGDYWKGIGIGTIISIIFGVIYYISCCKLFDLSIIPSSWGKTLKDS